MRMVVVRHGKAEHDSLDGTDFARELRPRGERQAAFLADRFIRYEPAVSRIVSSSAVRAWSTASIIGAKLGMDVEPEHCLLVDEPVSVVIDRISHWETPGLLVVVGHNPQLEHLVQLLGGRSGMQTQGLRTGEAVLLEVDAAAPIGGVELDRWRLEESD